MALTDPLSREKELNYSLLRDVELLFPSLLLKPFCQVAQTSGELEYLEVRNFLSAADGRTRGTLFPYDLSINGWCSGSESGSGGRQAYLLFDLRDFSPAEAVDEASLFLTFDEFPFGARFLPISLLFLLYVFERVSMSTCSTDWKENQVTWSEKPTQDQEIASCEVKGEDLDYPSEVAGFSCDVTSEVQDAAGDSLCITLYETEDGGSAQAIRIFSKEFREKDLRTGIWSFDEFMGGNFLEHGTVVVLSIFESFLYLFYRCLGRGGYLEASLEDQGLVERRLPRPLGQRINHEQILIPAPFFVLLLILVCSLVNPSFNGTSRLLLSATRAKPPRTPHSRSTLGA